MHAPKLAWYAAPDFVHGYLLMALFFAWYAWRGVEPAAQERLSSGD
jgi:AGZA family xanthine/uracil permease-like MFS transporter